MHTTLRIDSRALHLALALGALTQATLHGLARLGGLELKWAWLVGMAFAWLAGGIAYRQSRLVATAIQTATAAGAGKKKRGRKPAENGVRPKLDPAWLLRAAALAIAAMGTQWAASHASYAANPEATPWHAELLRLGLGMLLSTGLLAWGARFWLQPPATDADADADANAMSPAWRRVRDFAPAIMCLLAAWGMLALRLPMLFAGEMTSDMAQGLFWSVYDGQGLGFDGAGVAGWAQAVAYVSHAWRLPVELVPYVYQGAACLFWGACASAFAWPTFRVLVASDLARVLICMALICQPDYAVKTLAHVGAYAAVVMLLCIWRAMRDPRMTPMDGAVSGTWLSLMAISHPAGAAFVPALLGLLCVALYRRARPLGNFCALGLVGPLLQVWSLALLPRAASLDATADAVGFGALIGKSLAMLSVWGVGGKAVLSLGGGDDAAYVIWICAALAAVVCLAQTLADPGRGAWMGLAAVALCTAATGLAAQMLLAPEATTAFWSSRLWMGLAAPAWLVPCAAMFLLLGLTLSNSTLNRPIPWALGLWLFAGYPFGLGQLPRAPMWPAHGFSAWQALAPQVLGGSPPRGCIPVDPFPAYLGMDCQLLHSVSSATGLGGWMTFFNQVVLDAPEPADGWSTDGIGIAFNKTPPLDEGPWEIAVTLVALGADGAEIARSTAMFHPPEIFTHFTFARPVEQVARVRLEIAQNTSLAMGIESQQTREPFWLWFGRGEPEEGGEGVHLAETGPVH